MMKLPKFILILTLGVLPVTGSAAEMELTLDDAIARARANSVDAAVALDELKTAYWEWRTYKADRLPKLISKLPLLPMPINIHPT